MYPTNIQPLRIRRQNQKTVNLPDCSLIIVTADKLNRMGKRADRSSQSFQTKKACDLDVNVTRPTAKKGTRVLPQDWSKYNTPSFQIAHRHYSHDNGSQVLQRPHLTLPRRLSVLFDLPQPMQVASERTRSHSPIRLPDPAIVQTCRGYSRRAARPCSSRMRYGSDL